ncbi:uncharacterized protein LOC62_07G008915 [Vanrija pseudolonga]|uniref:Uncharacterized protein n=1 Tax=Vanrija pseudolonga TaxID=143232 RepID=A0AAF0YIT2_9TREE|nr:hypothetical protein LOC62_07G008915 [Vanrija pseudolonga]
MVRWSETAQPAPTKARGAYSTRPGAPTICGQPASVPLHAAYKATVARRPLPCKPCAANPSHWPCAFSTKVKSVAFARLLPVPYDDTERVALFKRPPPPGLDTSKAFIDSDPFSNIVDDILQFAAASIPNHATLRLIDKRSNDGVLKDALRHIDIRLILLPALELPELDYEPILPFAPPAGPRKKLVAVYHGTNRLIPFIDVDSDAPPEVRTASLERIKKYTTTIDLVPSILREDMAPDYISLGEELQHSVPNLRLSGQSPVFPIAPQTYIEFAGEKQPFRTELFRQFNDIILNIVHDPTRPSSSAPPSTDGSNDPVILGWNGTWHSLVSALRSQYGHVFQHGNSDQDDSHRVTSPLCNGSNVTIILSKHNIELCTPLPGPIMPQYSSEMYSAEAVVSRCIEGFQGTHTIVGLELIDPTWFSTDPVEGAAYKKWGAERWFLDRVKEQLAKCILEGFREDTKVLNTWWEVIRGRIHFRTVDEWRAEVGEETFALATNVNYALVPR